MVDRIILAQNLLNNYRTKAQELLVDYLRDDAIRAATVHYIGQHHGSPERLDAVTEQHRSPPHPDSSLPRSTRQNFLDARRGPYTPPTSAPSVKSHVSSLAGAGREKIYLITHNENIADQPVLSRTAPVKHNLIADKVVFGRGLDTNIEDVNEIVSVPLESGEERWEKAIYAVNLTWHRPKKFTTNMNTFYVVPARSLDSDVILSSDQSLERHYPLDVQEARSPQARYQRDFVDSEEPEPGRPPRAPTVPMDCYQQPSMPPEVQRMYEYADTIRENHRMKTDEPPRPPAATSHPRHIDHGQPTQTTTPNVQGPSRGQLYISGFWDRSIIQISFDPSASGEAFYQNFYQWAVRHKRSDDVERHKMTLWLKESKNTPDDEAYELSLKEGDLEELWEMACEWIQEKKRPKPPHLYATVELEAG